MKIASPTPITLPTRKCRKCGHYRTTTRGCQRPGNSRRGDSGFVCAGCTDKPRAA